MSDDAIECRVRAWANVVGVAPEMIISGLAEWIPVERTARGERLHAAWAAGRRARGLHIRRYQR